MRKVFLCGHTGSMNRGCEAIVRSTITILNDIGINNIILYSWDKEYDNLLGLQEKVEIVQYQKKNKIKRIVDYLLKLFLKDKTFAYDYFNKSIINCTNDGDYILNIGGDVYCYDEPYLSYSLNKLAKKKNINTIFWGCSIDEKVYSRPLSIIDINRYEYITTRESLSGKIFTDILNNKQKLIKTCDPAFFLEIKEVTLPENFKEMNTVGINVSPLMFDNEDDITEMTYQNIFYLIDWIIENTTMNICLIPHVYNIERNKQDIKIAKNIYEKYKQCNRVSIVQEELSCCQLKYIISKCRFFLGSRTHATIAAYSTSVPALAMSYSIKSRGIAKDLFGREKNFVISWKDLQDKYTLTELMLYIFKNENKIKERYNSILPEYKNSIINATKTIFGVENEKS